MINKPMLLSTKLLLFFDSLCRAVPCRSVPMQLKPDEKEVVGVGCLMLLSFLYVLSDTVATAITAATVTVRCDDESSL